MGISDEAIDELSNEFDAMSEQFEAYADEMDSQTAPSFPPFFGNIFGMNQNAPTESTEEKDKDNKDKKDKKDSKKKKYLDQYGVNLTKNA